MSSDFIIRVDIISLAVATIPLWLGLFTGCWVLLKTLVFKPLNEISKDLKDIKVHIFRHDERLTVLETKIEMLEKE
jgi:hypothetical protein